MTLENSRILHYEILRLLGRGGMGQVYEARDTRLGRRVALKFIAPELSADAESARRFEREATSAAALSHPHIATLYALEHDGPTMFIAMELMSGESLRDRIARGPMPLDQALPIARDVAAGLAHAHRRGIVHRDVKPENLMFDEEGAVKVMDFGLARAAQASRMTMTGTTLGTAAYMAPESIRGAVGAPADVFALGATLYEMLAGALPFPGESPLALLYMIANEEPRPLRECRPEVPEDVEALVARMLAKDPAARAEAATIARELSARTGVPPPAPEPAGPAVPGAAATASGPVPATVSEPVRAGVELVRRAVTEDVEVERIGGLALVRRGSPGRRLARAGGIALVALLALVGGALALQRWRSADPARQRLRAKALSDQAVGLMKDGAVGPAMLLLERALDMDPRSAVIRLNLAQALRVRGEATRAAAEFDRVAKDTLQPAAQRAQAWSGLADITMDDGSWPRAAEHLGRAFALDSSERAFSQLGYALVRSSRAGEALALLRRGLATYPGSAALHKNAAFALMTLDSLPAARAEADRALSADPGFAPALAVRARILARLGDAPRARADWNAYLGSRPDRADSLETAADLVARGALRP